MHIFKTVKLYTAAKNKLSEIARIKVDPWKLLSMSCLVNGYKCDWMPRKLQFINMYCCYPLRG